MGCYTLHSYKNQVSSNAQHNPHTPTHKQQTCVSLSQSRLAKSKSPLRPCPP